MERDRDRGGVNFLQIVMQKIDGNREPGRCAFFCTPNPPPNPDKKQTIEIQS